ncbi:hypothetical protein BEWA_006870 [Theileria equi strain WA]|uniref:PA14 domain-containing protein n=1 Tax=Theileria equi strain WA TaxID=1537102 RepID=L0B191_THEEQ|nr:hypothetical protein BEWA_006870 [Theileria equi strain WA]AFZ81278.1 hypothetical protein BEWA_006870 [Theileria equi strain WA]|eukprot:XP_004830944.1 hypothetical protein BEWA_006870 [Theileria equi strain WA]
MWKLLLLLHFAQASWPFDKGNPPVYVKSPSGQTPEASIQPVVPSPNVNATDGPEGVHGTNPVLDNTSVQQGNVAATENTGEPDGEDTNDLMYYLTQYRNRARRTEDGHLCAAAFVERDQVYTDCTLEVAPDGTTGREWCYLEAQLTGKLEKDWGFCVPPLNYDAIRSDTIQRIVEKVTQVDEMVKSLTTYRKLITESEKRLSQCCGLKHQMIAQSLSKIQELLEKSKEDLDSTLKHRNEIDLLQKEIKKVQCHHDELKRTKNSNVCMNEEGNQLKADGLIGTYYPNNAFEFPALSSRIDSQINFTFVNVMPIIGLNPHKFSIKWEGYLKAPHSGNFVFEIETDCYGRVELNGIEIINLGIRTDGDGETGIKYWIDPIISLKEQNISESQQLVGGKFYKIKVAMSHSQQYKFEKGGESHFKLLWSSHKIHREIIPPTNFYSHLSQHRISISNLPLEHFEISKGLNGEGAYRDNDEVFISNLSNGLIGTQLIRTDEKPTLGSFNLTVNDAATLYISHKHDIPFPLKPKDDQQWIPQDSSESFQLFEQGNTINMQVKSTMLLPHVIYKFQTTEIGSPFLLFMSFHKSNTHDLCVGREVLVSMPGTSEYLSCSESSAHSSEYNCSSALSGKYLDRKGSIWRTSGGTGEYIQVIFRRPILLTEFRFRPRDPSFTWPSKITLEFIRLFFPSQMHCLAEGSSETFNILHTNNLEHHKYRLSKPVLTIGVKITIEELYTYATETGGSFGLIGIPCTLEEGLKLVEIERCDETLQDLSQIHKLSFGDSFLVECKSQCIVDAKGEIKQGPFEENEPICTMASYTGYCHPGNGNCILKLQVDKNTETYKLEYYLLKSPNHHYRNRLFNVKILFRWQSDRTPTQGYYIDNGSVKSSLDAPGESGNSLIYGWMREAEGKYCNTDCNPLLGGGIEFPNPRESADCIQKEVCKGNYWSIDLPENGMYQIEIMLGSICDFKNRIEYEAYLQVNGKSLLNGQRFKSNQFYTLVKEIQVNNKMIKLTSTCFNDQCPDIKTVLQMVSIKQLNY